MKKAVSSLRLILNRTEVSDNKTHSNCHASASQVIMTLGFDTKPYIRWGLDNNNLLNIIILSPSEVYMQIPKSYPNVFLIMSLNPEPAIDIPHEQPAEKRL